MKKTVNTFTADIVAFVILTVTIVGTVALS